MEKKLLSTVTIIFVVAIFMAGSQGFVSASDTNPPISIACPQTAAIAPPPVQDGKWLYWTFINTFDPTNMTQFSYQIDGNILTGGCFNTDFGRECDYIKVELNGEDWGYDLRKENKVKDDCGNEIIINGGPEPSKFVAIPIGYEAQPKPSEDDAASDDSSILLPPMWEIKLIIKTHIGTNLSYDPGNTVIGKSDYTCRVCPSAVPAVKLEISTFKQFLNVGPCKAGIIFDEKNFPLPFKQEDLSCPPGISATVSDIIPNEKVLVSVEDPLNGDGLLEQNQDLPISPEPITFVQEPVKGQVPVAFKTNLNPTYWTYFPGFGWILVTY